MENANAIILTFKVCAKVIDAQGRGWLILCSIKVGYV